MLLLLHGPLGRRQVVGLRGGGGDASQEVDFLRDRCQGLARGRCKRFEEWHAIGKFLNKVFGVIGKARFDRGHFGQLGFEHFQNSGQLRRRRWVLYRCAGRLRKRWLRSSGSGDRHGSLGDFLLQTNLITIGN